MARHRRISLAVLAGSARLCISLGRYPLTWLVLALVGLTHGSFAWWFQPSLAMQWLALGIDGGAVLLWGRLLRQSPAFRVWQTRLLDDRSKRQAHAFLATCPDTFARPAQQCLILI